MPIDSSIVDEVREHARHIDTLSSAIEDLVTSNGTTNTKIDKLVDAMSVQNVLIEKVNNIDKSLSDSFSRRDARLDALENMQLVTGCSKVQLAKESVAGLGRSVDIVRLELHDYKIESKVRMTTMEDKIGTFISGKVVMWAIGIFITVSILYVTVVGSTNDEQDKELHRLDKLATDKIHMQQQVNTNNIERFNTGGIRISNLESTIGEHLVEYRNITNHMDRRLLIMENANENSSK